MFKECPQVDQTPVYFSVHDGTISCQDSHNSSQETISATGGLLKTHHVDIQEHQSWKKYNKWIPSESWNDCCLSEAFIQMLVHFLVVIGCHCLNDLDEETIKSIVVSDWLYLDEQQD